MSEHSESNQLVPLDEEMYVVEAIRAKRFVAGKPQYLVKWLHWDKPEDLTWEPIENLMTVQDLIEGFQKKKGETEQKSEKKKESKPKQKLAKSQIKVQPSPKNEQGKKKKQQRQAPREKQKSSRLKENQIHKSKQKQKQKQKEQNKTKQRQKTREKEKQKKAIKSQVKQQKNLVKSIQQISISSSGQQESIKNKGFRKSRLKKNRSSSQEKMSEKSQSSPSVKKAKQEKPQLGIGEVNWIILEDNGQIFYEVDIVNKDNKCITVAKVTSQEVKRKNKAKLAEFLEGYLLHEDLYAKQMRNMC